MANITIYKVESYRNDFYRIFSGVYNDFKLNAASDYNFELEPLDYDNFVKSVEKGLIHCLILFEDGIPTGFLVYTTMISESLELNIVHCIGNENLNAKRKLLIQKFLDINKHLLNEKVVTYPMLGKQAQFSSEITKLGFKTVSTSVLAFNLSDVNALNTIKEIYVQPLENKYTITDWKQSYLKAAAQIVHNAFKDSSDALFDKRFTSERGSMDIIEKITDSVYGKFLPEITKVVLFKNRPVGLIFANLTNDNIANIPIAAILKKHRGKGLGKILLKQLIDNLLTEVISKGKSLKELNVSCDSDNIPAYYMYTSTGFSQQYTYQQAYRPVSV